MFSCFVFLTWLINFLLSISREPEFSSIQIKKSIYLYLTQSYILHPSNGAIHHKEPHCLIAGHLSLVLQHHCCCPFPSFWFHFVTALFSVSLWLSLFLLPSISHILVLSLLHSWSRYFLLLFLISFETRICSYILLSLASAVT